MIIASYPMFRSSAASLWGLWGFFGRLAELMSYACKKYKLLITFYGYSRLLHNEMVMIKLMVACTLPVNLGCIHSMGYVFCGVYVVISVAVAVEIYVASSYSKLLQKCAKPVLYSQYFVCIFKVYCTPFYLLINEFKGGSSIIRQWLDL